MGVIIPSIPYKSQFDPDANEFRNDCGPASLAMMLNAFGVNVSTNAVFRKTGAKANNYTSLGQLMRAAQSYGYALDYFNNWTLSNLQAKLSEGRPLMLLVHYAAWSELQPGVSTQSSFKGPHFVLVVGFDDEHIYVNDPLWKDERRIEGYRRAWTHAQFDEAWSRNHEDGNRDRAGVFPQAALPTAPWGAGEFAAASNFQPDAEVGRRIRAWALSQGRKPPALDGPATLNAYLASIGSWGQRRARHIITENDDLGTLALRYYGDPMKWDVILAYNGLTATDTVHDGDVLYIPEPLDRPLQIPESQLPIGRSYRHVSDQPLRPF